MITGIDIGIGAANASTGCFVVDDEVRALLMSRSMRSIEVDRHPEGSREVSRGTWFLHYYYLLLYTWFCPFTAAWTALGVMGLNVTVFCEGEHIAW